MKYVHIFLLALLAFMVFGFGWWARALKESHVLESSQSSTSAELANESVQRDQKLAELEEQLQQALQLIAEQRRCLQENELVGKRARSIEEMFLLYPSRFPDGNWRPSETHFEDCWFVTADGVRLHGWYTGHEQAQAVLLYLHGNAGNITHRAQLALMLRERLNASVLLFDYRGYGRSGGSPLIDGLALDARAARDYLASREGIDAEQVVLMGRSLGGAVAVELAASDGARALVLESTFASLRDVAGTHYPKWAVDLIVTDRLDSAAHIGQYRGPVLISHGTADRTIPFAQGESLYDQANEPKTFVRIVGGDHNSPQTAEYYQRLETFFARLESD